MIIKDAFGNTAEIHLYDNDTGLDFVEEYLNAGSLDRDADGNYLVKDVPTLSTIPPMHVSEATPILKSP